VIKVNNHLIAELKKLYEHKLQNPFPYEDIYRIQEDFRSKLNKEDCLTGDLNNYCMNISGSISYVLAKKRVPSIQKALLYKDFFETYQQYQFLKDELEKYPDFFEELANFESARRLLIQVI
jgi:hypothetical protein